MSLIRVKGAFPIVVLAGHDFRGAHHYQNVGYQVSSMLGSHYVTARAAVWDFANMEADQLNDWYEEFVGYRPQVDDPTMTEGELRDLCVGYMEAMLEETADV